MRRHLGELCQVRDHVEPTEGLAKDLADVELCAQRGLHSPSRKESWVSSWYGGPDASNPSVMVRKLQKVAARDEAAERCLWWRY